MDTTDEKGVNDEVEIREKRKSNRTSRPIAVVGPYFEDSDSEELDGDTTSDCDVTGTGTEDSKDEGTEIPLQNIQVSSPKKDVGIAGFLSKKGGKKNNQGWKKRWFTFDGKVLKYFTNRKSQISLRIVPVAQMITVTALNSSRPRSRASADLFGLLARQYQFSLECKQRTFVLGTDSLDNCQQWQSCLMAAIIDIQKKESDVQLYGGEMNCPDKSGSIRFNKNKKKYFVALKSGILRYYYNEDDFAIDSPIHELNVAVIRVIEIDKLTLQIDSPPSQRFILHFDTTTEAVSWKTQLEDAIADILGDDDVYDFVKMTEGNNVCADCGSKDPKWASINLGIVICIKCAGTHRSLGSHITKVRSLRMDNIFKKNGDLLKLLSVIGNIRSNKFWYQRENRRTIDDHTPDIIRQKHIEEVYRDKKFVVNTSTSPDELNKELFRAVRNNDIFKTMMALFSGADIHNRSNEDGETVTELAGKTDNTVLKLFLELNINTDFRSSFGETPNTDEHHDGKKSSIYYEGYLEKTGPNLKGYQKRWCVLHYGAITYYDDKNKPVEKGCIDLSSTTSISAVIGNRQYSFDIGTTLKGRVYRFAAVDRQSMQQWMTLLSKVLGADTEDVFDDVRMTGHFYCKFHNTPEWTKMWLVLQGNTLFLRCLTKDRVEVVDISQKIQCFQCNVGKHIEKADDNTVMSNNHRVELVPADMSAIISIQGIVIKDTKKLYSLIQQMIS